MALKVHRTLMSPKCKRKDFLIPEMKYCIVNTIETDEKISHIKKGTINQGHMNRGEIKQPVITISVESIDATLSKLNHFFICFNSMNNAIFHFGNQKVLAFTFGAHQSSMNFECHQECVTFLRFGCSR